MALPGYQKELVADLLAAGFHFVRYSGNAHPIYQCGSVTVTLYGNDGAGGDPRSEANQRAHVARAIAAARRNGPPPVTSGAPSTGQGFTARDIEEINARLDELDERRAVVPDPEARSLPPSLPPSPTPTTEAAVMSKRRAYTPWTCPKCARTMNHPGLHPKTCRGTQGKKAEGAQMNGARAGRSLAEQCDAYAAAFAGLPQFFSNVTLMIADLATTKAMTDEMMTPFLEAAAKLKSRRLEKMFE